MKQIVSVFFVGAMAVLSSCSGGKTTVALVEDGYSQEDFLYHVEVKHAQGFAVDNNPTYKRLTIFSPGTRDTVMSYILYPRDSVAPSLGVTSKVRYIPVPQSTVACASSSEIGALPVLGLVDRLVGCNTPDYVCDSTIRQRIDQGLVRSIGEGMSRSVEQLIALHPGIYIQDMYSATEKDEDIEASGIHIVYYNNWKEQSLLGRAEWIKVVGLLFGRNQEATRAFDDMAQRYQAVKTMVAKHVPVPTPVMYGTDYKGVWYVPGERSYMANLFADAGISYDFIPGEIDSKPMSFEYVFSRHRHKKIWLCMMMGKVSSLQEFLSLNEWYNHFDAARDGQVWVDRKRVGKRGGNEFWESGPYHPYLLLQDLVKIVHPELLPEYSTTYWMQLK